MDFTLDTEQTALRDAIRELAGRASGADRIGMAPFDREQWGALVEMGVVAEEAIGPVEEMIVAEELGRARVRVPYAETVLAAAALRAADQTDLLERVNGGDALVVPALAEPGRAWGASPTASYADGRLTATLAPGPWLEAASHLIVATGSGAVLASSPEVAAGASITLDGAEATPLAGPGGDALPGGVHPSLAVPLARGTVALCAEALGAMQAALMMTTDYLKTRKQFGVPLMTFQTLTQRAADLYVQVELARSTVQYAAMTLADPDASAAEQVAVASRAKVITGKAGRLVGQESIQMHGGIGMTAEYAVGHLTARLTAIEHTWGDTRHHLGVLAAAVDGYETVEVI